MPWVPRRLARPNGRLVEIRKCKGRADEISGFKHARVMEERTAAEEPRRSGMDGGLPEGGRLGQGSEKSAGACRAPCTFAVSPQRGPRFYRPGPGKLVDFGAPPSPLDVEGRAKITMPCWRQAAAAAVAHDWMFVLHVVLVTGWAACLFAVSSSGKKVLPPAGRQRHGLIMTMSCSASRGDGSCQLCPSE